MAVIAEGVRFWWWWCDYGSGGCPIVVVTMTMFDDRPCDGGECQVMVARVGATWWRHQ